MAFALMASLMVSADFIQTRIFFSVDLYFANATIIDVTVSSDPLYAGATTDVFVTLGNGGSISANVSVNVSIFNSTGGFIQNISFSPSIVAPLSAITLSSSWATGSNPAGAYYANASGLYEDGINSTNIFSRQFQITAAPTATPTPGAPAGGGGGSSNPNPAIDENVTIRPTVIPDGLRPVSTQVQFIRSTPLKEMFAGTTAFESLSVKNTAGGTKSLTVNITGVPSSWVSYTPIKTIMLPSEDRAINLAFTIPQNALPGDYLVRIDAREDSEVATDYIALRIKAATRGAQFPVVLKTIRLDRPLGATKVTIDVINPSTKAIAYLRVIDEIIPELRASRDDIVFADKPAEVSGDPLQVKWLFRELAPLERASVSYSIYKLLQEYRPYVYWSVKQVEVSPKEIKLSDIVVIREIFSTLISEGGEGEVFAKVFYAGFEPVNFKATLEIPTGFETQPLTLEGVLVPRGTTDLKFKVRAPPGSDGTHSATISVLLDDEFLISQTGYVTVQRAIALSWQYILGAIIITIIFLLSLFHYLGKKKEKGEREAHITLREGYIKQIKRHIEK